MFTRSMFLAGCVSLCAVAVQAGPLNPPAGAVAPTARFGPRIEVNATNTPGDADSVFKISAPGSYYLGANLKAGIGEHGIEITSSGVTLDLSGFELSGEVGSLDGVNISVPGGTNVVVHNGRVTSFGGDGVNASGTNSVRIERISAFNCLGAGLRGAGLQGVIVDCEVFGCADHGIVTDASHLVLRCVSFGNVLSGISTGTSSTVSSCAAWVNGEYGIIAGRGSSIDSCAGEQNGLSGIRGVESCSISNCSGNTNFDDGISAGSGSTVVNSSGGDNTNNGISAGFNCTIINSSALNNSGDGISVSTGGSIVACIAALNGGVGIVTSVGSLITQCSASDNEGDGIQVNSHCYVLNNMCDFNGSGGNDGAGIFVSSASAGRNRIDGNSCTRNDRGIDVDGPTNFIVRNTCGGNGSNYTIATSNKIGVIVVPPDSLVIAGNSGAAGVGTTDPWANFGY